MPGAQERVLLSQQIASVGQVAAMSFEDLTRMQAEHELECLSLAGRIAASSNPGWVSRARHALRVLRLHEQWLTREIAKRKRAEARAEQKQNVRLAAQARLDAQRQITERQQAAEAARLARIAAQHNENVRHIETFKEVAREVLGAEMYAHIWELTRVRLTQPA